MDPISLTVVSIQQDTRRMEIIANNSANALTTGFKRELVAAAATLAADEAKPSVLGDATVVHRRVIDFSAGMPRRTANPLDLALLGEGFFEIKTDQGIAYTRVGSFRTDDQGRLVTQAGFSVQGGSGDLIILEQNPVIDSQGRVFDRGVQVGQLKIVQFNKGVALQRTEGGLFSAPPGSEVPEELSLPRLAQGYLESSNVESAREMTNLVETLRHFESSIRVLQAYDEMRDKALRGLGQF